ncbi:hypothetical protein AB0J25_28530, partial [Streptomyces sp. NPDC049910]
AAPKGHKSFIFHTAPQLEAVLLPTPHAFRTQYQRKLSEGKTAKEAKRCLKRRLADHVWRVMTADERRAKSCLTQAA